ncbi:10412_t:CDS:2, partial [Gigaspora margarita]
MSINPTDKEQLAEDPADIKKTNIMIPISTLEKTLQIQETSLAIHRPTGVTITKIGHDMETQDNDYEPIQNISEEWYAELTEKIDGLELNELMRDAPTKKATGPLQISNKMLKHLKKK